MAQTMAEKILARASGRETVKPGQYVEAKVDFLMAHDMTFYEGYKAMMSTGNRKVWDADRVVVIMDHCTPAPNLKWAEIHKEVREAVETQGISSFYDVGIGICHQVFVEKGHATPGSLVLGGDSHTTTYGAIGAAGCGIGFSEIAYVLVKGTLWFRVPETIQIVLTGKLMPGVSGKDIILHIAGKYKAEFAQYKSVEFVGPGASVLGISDRMTICNMGVEIGAKFCFFEADAATISFLKGKTGVSFDKFGADRNAIYQDEYQIDISSIEPQVALPHNVDNVQSISEISDIPIQQAFIGSCTNGRLDDLKKAAAILNGRKVQTGTRLIVIPASSEIYLHAVRLGIIESLVDAGAIILSPGCGPCGGLHMGIVASGEAVISSSNRNFKGRMGSPEGSIFLGSPETVAASAVEGKIADPRKYL